MVNRYHYSTLWRIFVSYTYGMDSNDGTRADPAAHRLEGRRKTEPSPTRRTQTSFVNGGDDDNVGAPVPSSDRDTYRR